MTAMIRPSDAVKAIAKSNFGSDGDRERGQGAAILLAALRRRELTPITFRNGSPAALPTSLLPRQPISHVGAGSDIERGIISDYYFWIRVDEFSTWMRGNSPAEKRGRPGAADWDAIEQALKRKIEEDGYPDKLNVPGWQRQADVEKWIAKQVESDGDTAAPSTVRTRAREMLGRLKGAD